VYNNLFEQLANNPSRNFKIDLLTKYSGDKTLKKIIFLALDPFTQFYIRKIPKYSPAKNEQADSLDSVLDSLYILSTRQATGNAGIEFLTNLLSVLTEDDAKVLERVIKKDLNCGVSTATVNTVWKNLIPEFPVMLCSAFEQKLVDNIKFPAIVQRKEDGMRFNAIVKRNSCEFRSRNGKQIELLGELEKEFITLANGEEVVFDGELLVVSDTGEILDRQAGNGLLSSMNKYSDKLSKMESTLCALTKELQKVQEGKIRKLKKEIEELKQKYKEETKKVNATIWDKIPYSDFVTGKCTIPYEKRFESLGDLTKFSKIHLVETRFVNSIEEASETFRDYLSNGFEGIILKDEKGIWENKRAKHQVKFKEVLECDLKIVDIQEGTGKYENMLGAIICETSDGLLRVSVGSGFNDEQRKMLINENLLDKIVTIKYNTKIQNKAGENSLFLPIFVEIRDDKDVADNFNGVK